MLLVCLGGHVIYGVGFGGGFWNYSFVGLCECICKFIVFIIEIIAKKSYNM